MWEVRRIVRGYRRRDRLKLQLMAECAWAAIYAMRDPKGKTAEDLFPMLFEEDNYDEPPISEKEVADMQALMKAFNSQTDEKETE